MVENQLISYNITDGAIAELKQKFVDVKEYRAVSTAISEVRTLRTSVETRRKELKADALEWGRKVDAEAKRITDLLLDIEEPLKAIKKEADDEKERMRLEKERIERERVEKITSRLNRLRNVIFEASTSNCEQILQLKNYVEEFMSRDFDYQEYSIQADALKSEVLLKLHELLDLKRKLEEEQRIAAEEAAKRQVELEAQIQEALKAAEESKKQQEQERQKLEQQRQELAERVAKLNEKEEAMSSAEVVHSPEELVESIIEDCTQASKSENAKTIVNIPEEMITIKKSKYDELVEDSEFLECLRAAGVDNWEGYDYACEIFQKENGDE